MYIHPYIHIICMCKYILYNFNINNIDIARIVYNISKIEKNKIK